MLRGSIGRWLLACAWIGGLYPLHFADAAQSDTETDALESIAATELSLDNPLARSPEEGEITIATIQITGNRSVSKKKIREKIDSRTGDPLDKSNCNATFAT